LESFVTEAVALTVLPPEVLEEVTDSVEETDSKEKLMVLPGDSTRLSITGMAADVRSSVRLSLGTVEQEQRRHVTANTAIREATPVFGIPHSSISI
jgi:hypothetical protein